MVVCERNAVAGGECGVPVLRPSPSIGGVRMGGVAIRRHERCSDATLRRSRRQAQAARPCDSSDSAMRPNKCVALTSASRVQTLAESEWQHFVPRMYLKGFLDPAKVAAKQHVLWVYQQRGKAKARGPAAVAGDHGFYYTPENPGAETLVETMLSKIATIASDHLEKLRSGALSSKSSGESGTVHVPRQPSTSNSRIPGAAGCFGDRRFPPDMPTTVTGG